MVRMKKRGERINGTPENLTGNLKRHVDVVVKAKERQGLRCASFSAFGMRPPYLL
jgi:hypothetical protein